MAFLVACQKICKYIMLSLKGHSNSLVLHFPKVETLLSSMDKATKTLETIFATIAYFVRAFLIVSFTIHDPKICELQAQDEITLMTQPDLG